MRYESHALDLVEVLNRSANARELVESYRRQANDDDRTKRVLAQECQGCYYQLKVGGSVCTSRQCGLCDNEIRSGSTSIHRLCLECAKAHSLCRYCGGDINMKQRRSL